MQVNELLALYISGVPIEREITVVLDSGETVKQIFYFREMSHTERRRYALFEQSTEQKLLLRALSVLISCAVCDAEGKAIFTEVQAGRLKSAVSGQLRDVIMEVNGLKKPPVSTGLEESPGVRAE
jgi:hypothetical protein